MCRQQSTQYKFHIAADVGHTHIGASHEPPNHPHSSTLHRACEWAYGLPTLLLRLLLYAFRGCTAHDRQIPYSPKPNSRWFTPNLLCEAMQNNLLRRRYFYWILSDSLPPPQSLSISLSLSLSLHLPLSQLLRVFVHILSPILLIFSLHAPSSIGACLSSRVCKRITKIDWSTNLIVYTPRKKKCSKNVCLMWCSREESANEMSEKNGSEK